MNIHPYALPLQKPLSLAGGVTLKTRKGVWLHDPQTGGWGDAAPLPGFSEETLEEVLRDLKAGHLEESGFPSIRFAVECARRSFGPPHSPVAVNALWQPENETVDRLVSRLKGWKNPVVKIKMGPDPAPAPVLELIKRCPRVKVRIDPNRRWNVETVLRMVQSLPAERVEYLEEPLRDPAGYEAVWRREPVPIALDESLRGTDGRSLAEHEQVRGLVIKPTLTGNEEDRRRWVDLAVQRKISLVWSSSFESGIGLWHLAGLAQGGGCPAGLDTGGVFERDAVIPRPLPEGGMLPVPETLEVRVSGCELF